MRSDKENRAYFEGSRRAHLNILTLCLRALGVQDDDPITQVARWTIERQETISALRSICGDHGDNDWGEDLYIPDIIEKHLARHLRRD